MSSQSCQKLLRVQSTRSTSGCRTCKSRRVKCDEGRPECQRCLKARVLCHYDQQGSSQSIKRFVVYSIPRALSQSPDLIHSERRSLHYFRCRASLQVTAPFRSSLWIECVFQLAERHSFVSSALVALSRMHESYCQEAKQREESQADSMHHYGKAMREIGQITQSSSDTYALLVSSILFYTFESLCGRLHNALLLIQSGIKILGQERQLLLPYSRQPSLLAKSLVRDFLSMQNQVMELGNADRSRAYDTIRGFDPPLPEQFTSVEDALHHMEIIYNEIHCGIDYYEDTPADVIASDFGPRCEQIYQRLGQWSFQFGLLKLLVDLEGDERQHQALLILEIYQLIMKTLFDNLLTQECFERFDPDIARILDLAEQFLRNEEQGFRGEQCAFSLSLGVIPPLFMISYRCYYAPLRDKALGLLCMSRRREGIWDSAVVTQLAQGINAFKSRVTLAEDNSRVQVSTIRLISETECQVEFNIMKEQSPVFGEPVGVRKHVEMFQLAPNSYPF